LKQDFTADKPNQLEEKKFSLFFLNKLLNEIDNIEKISMLDLTNSNKEIDDTIIIVKCIDYMREEKK